MRPRPCGWSRDQGCEAVLVAEEIRRAVEAAPRVKLPKIAALLWRAYGAGQVTEIEAGELSELIEKCKCPQRPLGSSRKAVGSRPLSSAPVLNADAAGRPLDDSRRH